MRNSDSTVSVEAIQHPRDTGRFVKTWWRVYREDPRWVPPLIGERKRFFNPQKNPYFESAEVQSFIATKRPPDVSGRHASVGTPFGR